MTYFSYRYVMLALLVSVSFGMCAQINLDSGLIAYYKLDGNVWDESVISINGIPSALTLASGRNNIVNTAYSFNGINSEIDCGIDNRGISDTITISAWVKTSSQSYSVIAGKYDGVADKGFHLLVNFGNLILAGRNNGSVYTSTWVGSVGNFVADGNWHFVMGEIAGNRWTVWVDSVEVNQVFSNTTNPSLINSEPLTIGCTDLVSSTPTNYFNGIIDEVRVYKRGLTIDERGLIFDINYQDPEIVAPLLSNDTTVCIDSLYTLMAVPDTGLIYWQYPIGTTVGTGNTFSTSSSQNQIFHVFSVLNGIHSDTATVSVSVQNCNRFLAPVGPIDTTVCIDSLFTLSAFADSGMVFWESPLGNVIGTGNTLLTSFSQSGDLYFYAVSNGFFSDTNTISVTAQFCSNILDPPLITNDTNVCADSVFTLAADVNAGVVYWIDALGNVLGNGSTYTTSINQTTSFYAYIEYNVQISDTAQVMVTVEDCFIPSDSNFVNEEEIVWPNIFTPNKDGVNDYFIIPVAYSDCLIGAVYNRWGTLLYQNNGAPFYWDGNNSISGVDIPSGIYYYAISYCENGEMFTRKGMITLLR